MEIRIFPCIILLNLFRQRLYLWRHPFILFRFGTAPSFLLHLFNPMRMKTFPFFSVPRCLQCSRRVLLLWTFAAGLQTALSASTQLTLVQSDTLPPKMPCYDQLEKEVKRAALDISVQATSIPGGVVDFIAAFARLNRKFYVCLDEHYPLGKK